MHGRWLLACLWMGCATSPPAGAVSEASTEMVSGSSGATTSGETGEPTTSGSSGSSSGGSSGSSSSGDFAGTPGSLLIDGGTVVGVGLADVRAVDGIITAVGELTPIAGEKVIDATGKWVAPAFIDSHVHLLYLPEASEMAANGVAGVVDLAAPVEIFTTTSLAPLRVVAAGR